MKTNRTFLAAVFFSTIVAVHAQDVPKAPTFARYDAMMKKSPFAVATAVAPPPQTPNFAKDLYLTSAAKLQDEGLIAFSSSTDRNLKEYVSTKQPNPSGYSIVNIDWSEHIGETKATISKDGQTATLNFNQALLSQPAAGNAMPPPPPVYTPPAGNLPAPTTAQPAAPYNGNTVRPAPIPTLPTPPPRTRATIRQNPNAPQATRPVNAGIVPDEQ